MAGGGQMAGALFSMAGGTMQMIQGAKDMSRARAALEAYKRQNFSNAYAGLTADTQGMEVRKDLLGQSTSTSIDTLQASGDRALASGLGQVLGRSNTEAKMIESDQSKAQLEIDKLIAQDNVRIQAMTEKREEGDLAGLGKQLDVGRQGMQQGFAGIQQGVSSMGGAMGGGSGGSGGGGMFSQFNTPNTSLEG
jgi:hypothetical protein